MKTLFIGGTGTISMAITKRLVELGWEVTLLNRGGRAAEIPAAVEQIHVDINDEAAVAELLKGRHFDTVADFIGFVPAQVERDIRLFSGKTNQYIYISSASAYHKPCGDYRITEGTALANPYWEYSRNKIACEELLMKAYRETGFPVTIVRPSHTYDERNMPVGIHGSKGSWQVLKRMLEGKPVIIHGDGTSLWTVTFNTDFAIGFTGLMGDRHTIGEAYQITGDESLTWNQIYATIADALGVELKAVHVASEFLAIDGQNDYTGALLGDKANTVVFDNSKLKKIVPDFCTHVPFSVGARKVVDNLLAHPELQRADPAFDAWCDKVIAALDRAKKEIMD